MSPTNTPKPFDAEVLAERLRDVAANHFKAALGFGITRDHFERCAREAAKVAQAMASAPVATDWRSMDTAPLNGREVLLQVELRAGMPGRCLVGHYMPGGHCIEDHPPIAQGWYFWDGREFDLASKPTGWLPLPPDDVYSALASAPVAGEAQLSEYRRGVMDAFHLANMANANRQGRTAEETCAHLVRSLADLANGDAAPQASEAAHKEAAAIARSFGAPDMADALDPTEDTGQAGDVVLVPARRMMEVIAAAIREFQILVRSDNAAAAVRTLTRKGYTWHGGEEWKPALGDSKATMARLDASEALEVARTALMEIANLADVEADQRGVIVHRALTRIAQLTASPLASEAHAAALSTAVDQRRMEHVEQKLSAVVDGKAQAQAAISARHSAEFDALRGLRWSPKELAAVEEQQHNALLISRISIPRTSPALLASLHTGMRVDYRGLLRQAREVLGAGSALAEMLRQLQEHLLELGQRWYSGDTAVVDELLQLYCVESEARAALATRLDQHKAGVSDA